MLQGKTAPVTGSTSGIGLAIAQRLAAEGANITINGFGDAVSIEGLRAGISASSGVTVLYDSADMSHAYALTPLVEKQIPDTAKARGITEEQEIRDGRASGRAHRIPVFRRRIDCRSNPVGF